MNTYDTYPKSYPFADREFRRHFGTFKYHPNDIPDGTIKKLTRRSLESIDDMLVAAAELGVGVHKLDLSGTYELRPLPSLKLEQQAKQASSGGLKYDTDKLPLDLLDPVAIEGLAKVLQFGAHKYASHNWRKGISYTRLIAALLRHTFAIMRGELTDPESGLPHIDHVGCCWMFLSNMMKTRQDLNDIYLYKQEETTQQTK